MYRGDEMKQIGLIGPEKSIEIIESVLNKVDFECQFDINTYASLEEIKDIYNKKHHQWDGVLFSGELGHTYLEENVENLDIISRFILFDEKHILGFLLRFLIERPELPLSKIYVDFIGEVNDFMGLKRYIPENHMPKTLSVKRILDISYDDLLDEISELWQLGEIELVLTRVTNNIPKLEALGIPYIHVLPTDESIIESIHSAIKEIELDQMKKHQSAVGLIEILPEGDKEKDFKESEYDEVSLHKVLVDYRKANNLEMSIQKMPGGFEITFGKNQIDGEENNFAFPLIDYIKTHFEGHFNIGIGFGNSIEIGRYHALKALKESRLYDEDCGFIASPNRNAVGPIDSELWIRYKLPDEKANGLAKRLNISPSNLVKVIALWDAGFEPLTSEMVAQYLNITLRSANRILTKLYDYHILKLYEKEGAQLQRGKGRPTKAYVMDEKYLEDLMDL